MGRKAFMPAILFLAFIIASIAFVHNYAKKENTLPPDHTINEAEIISALESTGLHGVISESETYTNTQGYIHYVVRQPIDSDEDIANGTFVADITSGIYDDERFLLTIFYQGADADESEWEKWKQQIELAAVLYGFDNTSDLYQAICKEEYPISPDNNKVYKWIVELPEEYCIVSLQPNSNKTYDENGFEVRRRSDFLRVNIYGSYGQYQKIQRNAENHLTDLEKVSPQRNQ